MRSRALTAEVRILDVTGATDIQNKSSNPESGMVMAISRRETLMAGGAATALLAFPTTVRSSSTLAIYYPPAPSARAFAARAVRLGIESVPVAGDVTSLWQDRLRPFWRAGPGRLIGMTGADTLFCLDLLARDHGQRLRFNVALVPGGAVPRPSELLAWAKGTASFHAPLPHDGRAALHAWAIAA